MSTVPEDWESLAKRMIAAMQRGLRIEQDSGHRWVFLDVDADFTLRCLKDVRSKQYGSYKSTLDEIDKVLVASGEKTLLETFEDMLPYSPDLGVVFGDGVQ